MAYEKYKTLRSPEEFWDTWEKEEIDNLTPALMEQIYQRYVVKCIVFQRDNFQCQNENCGLSGKITLHHIRFQKNDGEDKPKNCITICQKCHKAFHRGKKGLTFNGMTYKIHKEDNQFNWKEYKSKAKKLRKENREFHGIRISLKLLMILMKFLETDYTEHFED